MSSSTSGPEVISLVYTKTQMLEILSAFFFFFMFLFIVNGCLMCQTQLGLKGPGTILFYK